MAGNGFYPLHQTPDDLKCEIWAREELEPTYRSTVKVGLKVRKPHSNGEEFVGVSFEETTEKIAMRFEGNSPEYEIILCQYFDYF